MNKPANNPPKVSTPTTPSQALRVARLVIALGLCVGIGVFAVFTIQELEAGQRGTALPTDFGASKSSPADTAEAQSNDISKNPLAGLGGLDPNKYPPITRPNPHPGQFAPFLRADPHSYPYEQKFEGGETWEICTYQVKDASLRDLIAHYDAQAKQVGMTLSKHQPTSEAMPGGIEAAWSDGRRSLRVTGVPLPSRPAQPPLRPATPLQWVVQYSYPAKGQ